MSVPIDLSPAIDSGVLTRCECKETLRMNSTSSLRARMGDDGESMGLAIAKCRGWSVLTDDKKARRIAKELGVVVMGTPEVMKQWSEISEAGRGGGYRWSLRPSSDSANYRLGPRGRPLTTGG